MSATRLRPSIGSSPLARGTRHPTNLRLSGRRFIPTRAGNTSGDGSGIGLTSVHPHSRGEHMPHSARPWPYIGSSPLARGTRCATTALCACLRFIPTRAGNTYSTVNRFGFPAVHPHSRGEHTIIGIDPPPIDGSSPLARGTHAANLSHVFLTRFIPTRAGNTPGAPRSLSHDPVHPHSRGEHDDALREADHDAGSSPLARGTRIGGCTPMCQIRFIPTRAGNTFGSRPF